MHKTLRIGIVAGELSGDFLAGGLLEALRRQWPGALEIEGIGGPRMEAAGCRSLYPLDTLSVMGLFEVLKHYPRLRRCFHDLRKHFLANPPDIFIGVDAPDFTLRLERPLKAAGICTVHYVSPTVWAWRENRLPGIIKACHQMLCLYPFEVDYYQRHQHPVSFVGHPLAADMPMQPDVAGARAALKLVPEGRYVALLPGSRGGEVSRLSRPFLETAAWLQAKQPDLQFLVPIARPHLRELFMMQLKSMPNPPHIHLFEGQARQVMAAADVILLASGTATLEAALSKKPMVVAYKLSAATYALVRRMIKVKYMSQPNLLANAPLVDEFLQGEVDAEHLGPAVLKYLQSPSAALQLVSAFQRIHEDLRQDSDNLAAQAVLQTYARGH